MNLEGSRTIVIIRQLEFRRARSLRRREVLDTSLSRMVTCNIYWGVRVFPLHGRAALHSFDTTDINNTTNYIFISASAPCSSLGKES